MLLSVGLAVDGGDLVSAATAEQLESLEGKKKVLTKVTKAEGNIKEKLFVLSLVNWL